MTPEEINNKYNRLVDAVRKMLGYQSEYFKYHARSDLDKLKYWRRQVSNLIDQEVKQQKSKQRELF